MRKKDKEITKLNRNWMLGNKDVSRWNRIEMKL